MSATPKLSSYLFVLVIAWMAVMTWRIYPQFKDTVRVDGRLTTVGEYIEDTCSERVGPAAETCLVRAHATAQRMLRREQGKSVLLIEAPLFAYLIVYVPMLLWRRRQNTALESQA